MSGVQIIRRKGGGVRPPDGLVRCFATVPRGAEEMAAAELAECGLSGMRTMRGGVAFECGREGLYRANLWLRTASRVLVVLGEFPCASPEELYRGVRQFPWQRLVTPAMTLAVDCSLRDSTMTHSGFVALKTKDAIVDTVRDACGSRPSVDTASPDLRVNVHLAGDVCTVSLDSSGDPLDRRGYRIERNEAPLRETLAAAVIRLTGWEGSVPLADPMCGSGTIPIEAAMMAARIPPGLSRRFGFERWPDFDRRIWERLLQEAEGGRREIRAGLVTGCDRDGGALGIAARNAAKARLRDRISLCHWTLEEFTPQGEGGVVIVNPPYGKRLGEDAELTALYRRIGDVFKQRCRGWTGFVLTGNMELAKQVGLKASRRHVLFNGPIECRLLRYDLY